MLLGDIVDQFLDEHSLTDTGSSEKTDLSSLKVRFQKVNDLDSCEQHLLRSGQVFELRRFAMNRESTLAVKFLHAVDGISCHIHHTSADLRSDRHSDRPARTDCLHTPPESVSRIHGHCTHSILADMLLHLHKESAAIIAADGQSFINSWELGLSRFRQIEMYIDYRAYYLGNMSFGIHSFQR